MHEAQCACFKGVNHQSGESAGLLTYCLYLQGVAGVISKTAPDVLCHAAVRARNSGVMLVACHDEEELAGIADWEGQQVQLQLSQVARASSLVACGCCEHLQA